ncbi:MAG TPA: protein kinase, partial [Steroidobacteraceae bacterium]|nr:protein kinase [Steroidobacteraceae bacterium]
MQTMLARYSDVGLPAASSDELVAARQWVDWLVAQSCTEGDFITQVLLLEDEDPEVAFEVLALLDQLHRRHQLSDELFTRVKGRLLQASLGYGGGEPEFSVSAGARFQAERSKPEAARMKLAAPRLEESRIAMRSTPALRIEDPAKGRLRPGDALKGRYRIVEILGRTDSGVVIEAIDEVRAELPDVSQRVTIHMISEERSRELALVQRLYRLQSLAHPGIQRMFDIDEDDGELFFTTEWLAATPLRQLLTRNSGQTQALHTRQSILGSVAAALAYAHSRAIFHGDVHAGNVLCSDSGEVRLHGFVQEGRRLVASGAADRLGYAWLVYEVLWAGEAPEHAPAPRARGEALRRPPGVTGEQWRLLRGALEHGEDAAGGALLRLFAAEDPGLQSFMPMHAMAVEPRQRRQSSALAGTSAMVAFMGLGGYALVQGGKIDSPIIQRAPVEIAATIQPAPPEAASLPAATALPATTPAPPPAETSTPAAPGSLSPPVAPAQAVQAPVAQRRAQLDLPDGLVRVTDDQQVAKVWVRRRGNMQGPVTFQWWTEASSAQGGRDFAQVAPQWEVIADGSPGIELLVPLVKDSTRTQRRTFYVKLHRVGSGGTLGERTLAQVEIVPSVYQRTVATTAE